MIDIVRFVLRLARILRLSQGDGAMVIGLTYSPRGVGVSSVVGCLPARTRDLAASLCLAGWVFAAPAAFAQTAPECVEEPSWGTAPSLRLPGDVCGGGSGPHNTKFFLLSWRIFKFLVWPAAPGERGVPDEQKKITDVDALHPRTFETFKPDWEIFRAGAAVPIEWNEYPSVATPCTNLPKIDPRTPVLASFDKFGSLPALNQVLVAQNRTYARYQPAFNKTVFDKIKDQRLFNANVVGGIRDLKPNEPASPVTKQDDGALTIKSAWIELPEGSTHFDRSRFYIREKAWVQDLDGSCKKATVALVGLHFVYKTPSRPQWIWSTFEHVDNVPDNPRGNLNGSERNFVFNNGDVRQRMKDRAPQEYRIPPHLGDPPPAYQVERLQRIKREVLDANEKWQTDLRTLGSVWQFYKLVMTQWPTIPIRPELDAFSAIPDPFCNERNKTASVNTTMETFLQTQQGCHRERTCMGCHNNARTTDFIFSIPLNPYRPPEEMITPDPRAKAIKALQEVLHKSRSGK